MLSTSPTIQHVERFIVTGLQTRTKNRDEFHEKTAKIPNLWQQFYSSEIRSQTNIFAIYSDYESDANGLYTVTVGIQSDELNARLQSVTVESGQYLVFRGNGSMPATVIETWKQIWTYFEETRGHQRIYRTDFEIYESPEEIAIYIGIK